MAVAVALLMIGGEFDLSAGVMTASTALVTAILATQLGLNVWLALLVSLVFALSVGAINGWLVMRTGLPSFIVTLGTFLALQGLNLGVTRLVTGTVQVTGMRGGGRLRVGRVPASRRRSRSAAQTFHDLDPLVDPGLHRRRVGGAGAHQVRQLDLRGRRLRAQLARGRCPGACARRSCCS